VEYVERFEVDDVLHIIMHYCEGGDLAAHIKEKSKGGGFYSEKVMLYLHVFCLLIKLLFNSKSWTGMSKYL
jgi:hypothetical protein